MYFPSDKCVGMSGELTSIVVKMNQSCDTKMVRFTNRKERKSYKTLVFESSSDFLYLPMIPIKICEEKETKI